jgi:hypothetical protein
METIFNIPTEQITQIALFVVGLVVVWGLMRWVLHITKRVFQFGCLAIVLFGFVLAFMRFLGGA